MKEAYGVRAWNRVANLARVLAIHQHGGIYLDTDIELLQSLDPLLHHKAFVGFQSKHQQPDWANNAVFAAEAGHWLPGAVIDALMNRRGFEGLTPGNSSFGPGQLTKILLANGLSAYDDSQPVMVRDAAVYPIRYFYPYAWNEKFTPDCVKPDTIAIHHWDASWIGSRGRIDRVKRKMRGMAAEHFPEMLYRYRRRQVARLRPQVA
jgi:mannosyltransferase OCH1-like enzyme